MLISWYSKSTDLIYWDLVVAHGTHDLTDESSPNFFLLSMTVRILDVWMIFIFVPAFYYLLEIVLTIGTSIRMFSIAWFYIFNHCRCWIRSWSNGSWSYEGSLIQLTFYYIPVLLSFLYNLSVYVYLSQKIVWAMSIQAALFIQTAHHGEYVEPIHVKSTGK